MRFAGYFLGPLQSGVAGVELDADRAAAAAEKGIAIVHGSAFECRVFSETCSLLYLNPPYDSEFEPHSNKRLEESPSAVSI